MAIPKQERATTTLVILDGWGHAPDGAGNAVSQANTPNFDRIVRDYPGGFLAAHGEAVGLPDGQMGNSEVGHTTIGAGRIVWMDLPRIDRAIADDELAGIVSVQASIAALKVSGGSAHIMGLASDGGVHAHHEHIIALAKIYDDAGIPVILHLFTDGRDVAPKSAGDTLPLILDSLPKAAKVATICGRFYALDRDNRWERVGAAYKAIVNAEGAAAMQPIDAVTVAYANGDTDEFVAPTVIGDYAGVVDGDGLVFANFRADRAREILAALADPAFDGFERTMPKWASALGMVSYSSTHNKFMDVIFSKENIKQTLGAVVAEAGMTQLRLAETEKYPHVTFFMNGGEERPSSGEDRFMAPSPKVRTYDLQPEMSAPMVGDKLAEAIGEYDMIICNFANPDMVGHTGDIAAAIASCEAVDEQLGRAIEATLAVGGQMIVTADHGNCEVMIDPETGGPHTAHTLNPVRYTLVGVDCAARAGGGLSDLAPTMLKFLGLAQPEAMKGEALCV